MDLSFLFTQEHLLFFVIICFALPEWIVFACTYLSTFINVFRRPEKSTSRILTVFLMIVIFGIRTIYALFFIIILPHDDIPPFFAILQRYFLLVIAVWWMIILCGPAFYGVISWLLFGVGNKRLDSVEDYHKPIYCILPVYNEQFELLVDGIDSILTSDYPKNLLELHISFDDGDKSDLWKNLVKKYDGNANVETLGVTHKVTYENGATIYIHRWEHGGKRHAQSKTWHYIINKTEKPETLESSIFILTDSDNIMFDQALNNLSYKLHFNPKKIAYAGYMSCMSKATAWWKPNFVRYMQDTEYVSSEINRFFELSMGTVNCLPGGFTAIRYSALKIVAPVYFTEETDIDTITLYHMKVLGEDRYLTHLVHKTFPKRSIGFCPLARCKTDPPETVCKYIKQRRRWLLGSIANEGYMLCTPSLWRKFPILLLFKLIQTSWRSTTFCQSLIAISAIKSFMESMSSDMWTYPVSVGTPVLFAWIAASIAGLALKRYKVVLFWPLMILGQTVLQIFVDIYSLLTWNKRTWGGPRTSGVINVV